MTDDYWIDWKSSRELIAATFGKRRNARDTGARNDLEKVECDRGRSRSIGSA